MHMQSLNLMAAFHIVVDRRSWLVIQSVVPPNGDVKASLSAILATKDSIQFPQVKTYSYV